MRGTLQQQAARLQALADEAAERLADLEYRQELADEFGCPGPGHAAVAEARQLVERRQQEADRARQQLHEAA